MANAITPYKSFSCHSIVGARVAVCPSGTRLVPQLMNISRRAAAIQPGALVLAHFNMTSYPNGAYINSSASYSTLLNDSLESK